MSSVVYGGLDVHQKSIAAFLLCDERGEVGEEQVANDREHLLRALRRWGKVGELRLCYEASGAGLLHRVHVPEPAAGQDQQSGEQ